jgi:ABC-type polysaccharide/polyol phosphate export systems, permease component
VNKILEKPLLREPIDLPHLTIQPRKVFLPTSADWKELFASRDLIMMLVSRDLSSRYRRALLGGLWAVLQPLFGVFAFSFVINRVMKVPSDGIPYMLYVWSAMLLWQFVSGTVTSASTFHAGSMTQLINKVYFPRLALPLAALGRPLVDLAINTVLVLLATALVFHLPLTLNLLWMPVFIALAVISTFGILCWTSALCVIFYDFNHLLPFTMQVFFITCPVMYSVKSVPGSWSLMYNLNPIAAAVNGFRWSIVGAGLPPSEMLLLSYLVALLVAAAGALFYFHSSRYFTDLI